MGRYISEVHMVNWVTGLVYHLGAVYAVAAAKWEQY